MRQTFFAASLVLASMVPAAPLLAQSHTQMPAHYRGEANGTQTLTHEVVVGASSADVWEVISTPTGWQEWAVPVAWHPRGRPEIIETSYDPAATPGSAGTIQQHVVATIPGRILVFRTVKAPAAFPHWPAYRRVINFFELEPLGPRSTRVRLTGVGFPGDTSGQAALEFFKRGNGASLAWLRDRFVSGPADWGKRLGLPVGKLKHSGTVREAVCGPGTVAAGPGQVCRPVVSDK